MEGCRMKANGYNRDSWLKTGLINNSDGFTLIELSVAAVIIAIMVVAAVPSVNGYLRRHAPQHAADELYGDIQLARMRAARNNQRCRISFNVPAPNQYTLIDVANNGLPIGPVKTVDLTRHRGGINFVLSPNAADNAPFNTLEFLPSGILDLAVTNPANSNSVYLSNQANDVFYRVLVSAAGGSAVDRWNQNTNQWR